MTALHWGQERVLEVGDVVSAQSLKSVTYDQGTDGCSLENEASCEDTFSFIPFSSWAGRGVESESFINLTPVVIEEVEIPKAEPAAGAPLEATAPGDSMELN